MSVADPVADRRARANARLAELARTDPELAALLPITDVTQTVQAPWQSFEGVIAAALKGYGPRPAIGERRYAVVANPNTGRAERRHSEAFEFTSYDDLRRRGEALASAWRHHPDHRVDVDEFVAIFGVTGRDMITCDVACVYAQAVSAPIQVNLPEADIGDILADIEPASVVTSIESIETTLSVISKAARPPRSVVVFGADLAVDDEREKVEAARAAVGKLGAHFILLKDLIAFGSQFSFEPLPRHPAGDERLSLLIFTSGSTGTPKGAMWTDRIVKRAWQVEKPAPTVVVTYAPMHHSLGRSTVFNTLGQGGSIYVSLRSDLSTLFQDIRLARPTNIRFIPRIADLVWQHYLSEIARRSKGAELERARVEQDVRAEMRRAFLGDRLCFTSVASAPAAPEVKAFISDCFDVPLSQGYGTTEAGGAVCLEQTIDRRYVTAYKLRDVPELGYYASDRPFPRGELLVKSKLQIPGYFKKPQATAGLFTEDGYLQTGDIVEELAADKVRWLDRKTNVLKMSQGEFVSIGPLEQAFLGASPLIRQIYLYGNSMRAYLVAVVVPDWALARQTSGRDPDEAELKQLILDSFKDVSREKGLKGFEVPRDIIIEPEPFSLENGLLSGVGKPLRPALKRRYGEQLEALYARIEQKQRDDLLALRDGGGERSVLSRLGSALEASLGIQNINLDRDQSFADLGGDSLGAATFALLLEDIFGVAIPVSAIQSAAGSPRKWASMIEAALNGGRREISAASIHPDGASVIRARDLDLTQFVDAAVLAEAESLPRPVKGVKTVLLTGANGFLGRFLALEWLERLATVEGRLICLVRGRDKAQARRRFTEIFGDADPVLRQKVLRFSEQRLEVLPGDLAEPNLGLSAEDYARLAREVDLICHPAAFVNHVLPYNQLFEPNVVGTASLIQLALTGRMKRFNFISTVGVPRKAAPVVLAEAEDVRVAIPEIPITTRYASGYSSSKWAGEVLLREAHDLTGLPVDVYRPGMILAHSVHHGQLNVPDMFARLLYSLVVTGLAPESFYVPAPGGGRAPAHYDGLPVDFVAAAMVGLGRQESDGFRTFNIINYHDDDGVSLDSVADWVASAGYPLERIEHGAWVTRFEQKLRALPDDQRAHSMLNIMAWTATPLPPDAAHPATADFVAALEALDAGPHAPQTSEPYIHKHLDDLRRLGLLPEPA